MRSNRRPKLRQVLALASLLLLVTVVEGAEAKASMVSAPLSSITSVTLELSGMHCIPCTSPVLEGDVRDSA